MLVSLPTAQSPRGRSKVLNAYQVEKLMAPKKAVAADDGPPAESASSRRAAANRSFPGKDGLGAYIANPQGFPSSRVIYYTEDFVAINDMYPKSAVHCLLLPRKIPKDVEMFKAAQDPEFLDAAQREAQKLKKLVAQELERRFGKFSKASAQRQKVLSGEIEWDGAELPPGRDWEREVRVGIHSVPSMSHLHIHVASRDMCSDSLKHRKHYNSFNTRFFVDLDSYPLAEDEMWRRRYSDWSEQDLVCWQCGQNFKNKFKQLKEHLAEEFEAWKKE